MPTTTVRQLFNKVDLFEFQKVNWGTIFQEKNQGVYVVSTSHNPDKHLGISDRPNFDDIKINLWISKLPEFKVDNLPANSSNVKNRLAEFWLPDESILYIGKAPTRKGGSGISKRVYEFYSTIIGSGRPHSGGQWLKTLMNLDSLTVYYAVCDNPAIIEHQMLDFFKSNVSETTLEKLFDYQLPLPFANINLVGNKKHGFKNQRL